MTENQKRTMIEKIIDEYLYLLDVDKKRKMVNKLYDLMSKNRACTTRLLENSIHRISSTKGASQEKTALAIYNLVINTSDENIINVFFNKETDSVYIDEEDFKSIEEIINKYFDTVNVNFNAEKKSIKKIIQKEKMSIELLDKNLKRTFMLASKVNITQKEMSEIIIKNPYIITKSDFHYKYLLYAILKNENRKALLLVSGNVRANAHTIYSKIRIMMDNTADDFEFHSVCTLHNLISASNESIVKKYQLGNLDDLDKKGREQKAREIIRNYTDFWTYDELGNQKLNSEVLLDILSWEGNEEFKNNFEDELGGYGTPSM